MVYRVLAVGDVVGEQGLEHLRRHLRSVKKLKDIHFTVVNGENISGVGLTSQQAEDLYNAGADVITLGNHTFGKMQIGDRLESVLIYEREGLLIPNEEAVEENEK